MTNQHQKLPNSFMEGSSEDGNHRKTVFVFCGVPLLSVLIKYENTLLCRSSFIPQKNVLTLENEIERRGEDLNSFKTVSNYSE